LPTSRLWCDLGSGGGLPGLVAAIQAKEGLPDLKFILVESDQRKSVFLGQVARELELNVSVVNRRIDEVSPLAADIVSARGLASLDVLCGYASQHLRQGGLAIFPKGSTVDVEIDKARGHWDFRMTTRESHTDPFARVLMLEDICHVQ
jgi:16S rRNA (guanine527-N7)-methyltransferase